MCELKVYIEDYKDHIKNEQEERLILTYLNAAWIRSKKMPSIEKILGQPEESQKEMSDKEIFEQVKKLNTALGGSVY